ncbi:DUF1850 domain-containing protein [Cereibacter sphaeroides]|uniref:DUF1850 domain-containing protein n=1 Tax=Cereibacter sphaeroides TaxID=1063 RepID=A0AAX1UFA9_CERSP|nr:DUF1850 domain-containing protein [Cereibacter sphaeroides]EGJ23112.1 hypothetical protein RSWS8N_13530 [Cereibacter sphaeroides WS8N]MWP39738.1 DUF1850 domain-containing protein [Cereibacter sphaeroides]RHZ91050.1 DUF1850 domain-containing protein [Cereibacter sphaeroides]
MSLCVAAGAAVLSLAASSFTLSWTHSVEHVEWWERWEVTEAGLRPVEARIQGSGAGMELPPDAWREADGWHYVPRLPPQREVRLAASGMTGGGWRLCAAGRCHDLGAAATEGIRLWQSADCG